MEPVPQMPIKTIEGITDFSSHSHILVGRCRNFKRLLRSPKSGFIRRSQIKLIATPGRIDGR
jgi:hypothetical protein